MSTLISPENHSVLWAFIAAGAAASMWLEKQYRWAARLSAPVIALLLAMILSNARILPPGAPVYDIVEKWMVPLAIPLLLARANFRQIVQSGRGPLIAFHVAAVGTILGTALAVVCLRHWIGSPATEYAAGLMAASYSGGGVNFFAIRSSYSIDGEISGPLLVADNFVMAGIFVLLLSVAAGRWFRDRYPHPHIAAAEDAQPSDSAGASPATALDIACAFAFAFLVVAFASAAENAVKAAFGDLTGAGAGRQMLAALCGNRFVLLTLTSLVGATVLAKPLARIRGMDEAGSWMLMLFLFVLGLPADLWLVLSQAPLFFVFCAIIALVNLGFTLGVGRALRLNLEELLIAVNATLGGPPTAAAMASAAGWRRLVLPALLMGLWGYVIGTPIGILIIEGLSRLTG